MDGRKKELKELKILSVWTVSVCHEYVDPTFWKTGGRRNHPFPTPRSFLNGRLSISVASCPNQSHP